MMQVGRNLTDPHDGFLRGKRFLIVDRDKKFTTEFPRFARARPERTSFGCRTVRRI